MTKIYKKIDGKLVETETIETTAEYAPDDINREIKRYEGIIEHGEIELAVWPDRKARLEQL